MIPVPLLPRRVLLVIDDPPRGELLVHCLLAEGYEVRWARDTVEARWVWMRNYFESVIVCAQGANGFVQHIKKESPNQNITVLTPEELLAVTKKPPASITAISDHGFGYTKTHDNLVEMRQGSVPIRKPEKPK